MHIFPQARLIVDWKPFCFAMIRIDNRGDARYVRGRRADAETTGPPVMLMLAVPTRRSPLRRRHPANSLADRRRPRRNRREDRSMLRHPTGSGVP